MDRVLDDLGSSSHSTVAAFWCFDNGKVCILDKDWDCILRSCEWRRRSKIPKTFSLLAWRENAGHTWDDTFI